MEWSTCLRECLPAGGPARRRRGRTRPGRGPVQRAALPPLNVSACWAGLGVRFHRINVSDASAPFVRDALGASMARTLHDAGRSFSRVILADFARVYALLEHDQLRRERAAGRAFGGFLEGPVAFAPTVKFDKLSLIHI